MDVLVRPVITEKMTAAGEKFNRYGFIVNKKANKIDIKKAVETMYGVTVSKVRTITYIGKLKTRNTKAGAVTGRSNAHKKAIISLKEGETIDFYSNI
jgi:large subunit ribosomal protein L23